MYQACLEEIFMDTQSRYQNMSSCCYCDPFMERSLLSAAVSAQDVVALGEEAASHQRHGALHAGETLAVPLAFLKRDVLGPCQTCTHQAKIHVFI